MELCPSYIHLQSGKNNPEKFDLIDDPKIAHIGAIRANTPHQVSARLLACQNQKGQPQNYCNTLFNAQAVKKICDKENKTNYVYLYIDKIRDEPLENKPRVSPAYLAAFVRAPGHDSEIPAIIAEIKRTAEWLGVADSDVHCYIFHYSTNHLSDASIRDAYKNKFIEQCQDSKYSFGFQYIPLRDEKTWWLYINGGPPNFTIKVQET